MKRDMPKWVILMLGILIVISSGGCAFFDLSNERPQAVQGSLDLHAWDLTENGSLLLTGEWEFYWQQLLTPEDFTHPDFNPIEHLSGWMDIPQSWNDYQVNGIEIDGHGYATYRLRIHLGDTDSDQLLGLHIKAMSTAYKLWVNGQLTAENGKVGTSKETMIPQYLPKTIYFSTHGEPIELIIQVSNFHHRRGGLWDHMELGTAEQMTDKNNRRLGFELFIIGSVIIMGIYHLGLFAFRRSDRSLLYFGSFCLMIGFRGLLVGESFWYQLFPRFNWYVGLKLEYILTYMCLPVFLKYIHELYPKRCSKRISWLSFAIGMIFSAIVLFAPTSVFTHTLISYHVIILITIGYVLYVVITAIIHKEKGSILLIFGIIFYILTIVNDILYYNEFVLSDDYMTIGLFVFVFVHSIVLSMKFSKAFSDLRILSKQLQELNMDLESKVKERTHALVEFNQYLTMANKELYHMEKSRRHLLSNISHELRTPITSIQGYLEAFLDGVVVDPELQKRYLQLIHSKTVGLNRLIHDLFELSQLEARQISFSLQHIAIHQLMDDMIEKYETDIRNAGLNFTAQSLIWDANVDDQDAELLVYVDPDRIDQVFSNLIFNALRLVPKGGMITVTYEMIMNIGYFEEDHKTPKREILIKIKDTGPGIAKENLPYIFDRFYKENDGRNSTVNEGSGLGLAIAKEIVLSHGGRIWAESTLGEGSTFCFTIPVSDNLASEE